MSEPKPFASLSPSLLARKGAARPAMRPQLHPMHQFHEATARQLEDDLGWNDMGEHHDAEHDYQGTVRATLTAMPESHAAHQEASAPVARLEAKPKSDDLAETRPEAKPQAEIVALNESVEPFQPQVPEVVRQQAGIVKSVSRARKPRKSALAGGGRAAFTLRLDAERHLKLRLACTVGNRSAQQIVTEALDHLLADMPEIEALATQVKNRS